MKYIHLLPEQILPIVNLPKTYKCVVVIDKQVSSEWQYSVSKWLVETGCVYMMATGENCSSWDDSVDIENIEKFIDSEDIPQEHFVYTSWHEEGVEEAFFFSKNCATHPSYKKLKTIVLHISEINRETELKRNYESA